jgi:hypothetical protein
MKTTETTCREFADITAKIFDLKKAGNTVKICTVDSSTTVIIKTDEKVQNKGKHYRGISGCEGYGKCKY